MIQKKFKIGFQDGGCGSHLGFLIGRILVVFAIKITIDCLVHETKFKIDQQNGSHLGFLIEMILAVFDLQVAPILPTEFRVSWPFGS